MSKKPTSDDHYEFSFERLDVWKESRELVKNIYQLTKGYPKDEIYGICSQLRRAASSVLANISEGSYRSSMKERAHFYEISFGSLMEVLTFVLISQDLGYIKREDYYLVRKQIETVSIYLTGLRKSTRPLNK